MLPSFLAGGMPTTATPLPRHYHVTQISRLDGIGATSPGHKSIAALLQNRRMALENPPQQYLRNRARFAATRHQPSLPYDTTSDNKNSPSAVLVDYKETGRKVSLLQALNASYWNEYPIYENGTVYCIIVYCRLGNSLLRFAVLKQWGGKQCLENLPPARLF